ncbi:Fc.00g063300.m01.CDS01 [Cosmosporella sp. VM-42]
MASTEAQPLPPVNRYITTHDANGMAIWDESIPVEVNSIRSGGFSMHTSWVNENGDHDFNDDKDLKSYKENLIEKDLFPASGSVLRIVDIWPGFPAVMHRTGSVDYGIVIEGEVDCVLDDGASRTFKRGDIIIQRGTNHGWRNSGTKVARICFTLLPTPPVKIQGKELEIHHMSDMGRLAEESS